MSESVIDIDDALDFYLFEGDFGEQGERKLSEKIVKDRKAYSYGVMMGDKCHIW